MVRFLQVIGICSLIASGCDNPVEIKKVPETVARTTTSIIEEANKRVEEEEKPKVLKNENIPLADLLKNYKNPKPSSIIIYKEPRILGLYVISRDKEELVKEYPISLGINPVGDKVEEGDGRTPEGEYFITLTKQGSDYSFYKGLQISYPNEEDAKKGLESGLINKIEFSNIINALQKCRSPPQKTALGGLIQVHGNSYRNHITGELADWTGGCVGLEDKSIDEVFDFIYPGGCHGIKVEIKP